jgi:hypothetical protein
MALYRTTFTIDASADAVWAALTDFDRYPEWNPSVPQISGAAEVGSEISLTLAMPGRPSAKVKATLREVQPGTRLAWHGNVGADWLFSGTREFTIEPQGAGAVQVTHIEDVRGALFPLFRAAMGGAIQKHHEGFNVALKKRAEAR